MIARSYCPRCETSRDGDLVSANGVAGDGDIWFCGECNQAYPITQTEIVDM